VREEASGRPRVLYIIEEHPLGGEPGGCFVSFFRAEEAARFVDVLSGSGYMRETAYAFIMTSSRRRCAMAKVNERFLDTGDMFPRIDLNIAGGGTLALPDYFEGEWGCVLFYRGHW
jgi:hypothetical protein